MKPIFAILPISECWEAGYKNRYRFYRLQPADRRDIIRTHNELCAFYYDIEQWFANVFTEDDGHPYKTIMGTNHIYVRIDDDDIAKRFLAEVAIPYKLANS